MAGSVVEVIPTESGGREFCSFMSGLPSAGATRTLVGITPNTSGFTGVLEEMSFFFDGFNGTLPADFGSNLLSCRVYVDLVDGHMDDGDVLFSYDFVLTRESKPAFVSKSGRWSFVIPSGCALFFELNHDATISNNIVFGANFRWKSFDIVL